MAPKVPPRPAYLTKAQTAELLGISVRTLNRIIARGDLEIVKLRPSQSGGVRISTQAIEEFARASAA